MILIINIELFDQREILWSTFFSNTSEKDGLGQGASSSRDIVPWCECAAKVYIYNHRLAFIVIALEFHGITDTVSQPLVNTGNFQLADASIVKRPFMVIGNWRISLLARNLPRLISVAILTPVILVRWKREDHRADEVEKSWESAKFFFFLIRYFIEIFFRTRM